MISKIGVCIFVIGMASCDSEWWWFPLTMMLIGVGLTWLGEHRQNG